MSIYSIRFEVATEGGLVDAILKVVYEGYIGRWTSADLMAIGSRETGYLWMKHWGRFKDWAIIGDQGHGHGVFQIDDRSHFNFTSTADWRDPFKCALKAIEILTEGQVEVDRLVKGVVDTGHIAPNDVQLSQMYYSAYNVGPNYAVKGWVKYGDPSKFTTDHDYGIDVYNQFSIYGHLLGL